MTNLAVAVYDQKRGHSHQSESIEQCALFIQQHIPVVAALAQDAAHLISRTGLGGNGDDQQVFIANQPIDAVFFGAADGTPFRPENQGDGLVGVLLAQLIEAERAAVQHGCGESGGNVRNVARAPRIYAPEQNDEQKRGSQP